MQRRKAAMKKRELLKKIKWQWVVAIIVSFLLFGITYITFDIIFSTNDDLRIMYALAGYNTGAPYPYHPFINYFLGKAISTGYYLMPQLPWYAFFHIICLFVGTVVVGKCLIKLSVKRSISLIFPIVIHVFLFYSVLIFPVVSMQFSTTPAVLGSASIALIYSLDIEKDHKRNIYCDLILAVFFLLICYMTRSFTWYCVMCFFGLAVFYQILLAYRRDKKQAWKWISILAGSVLLTGGIVLALRGISLSMKSAEEENAAFDEYNKYRIEFQDYGIYVDYYSDPEFYEQIGWSENTYRAAFGLLFFDEEMNAANLREITEKYKRDTEPRGIGDTYHTAKSIFDNYRIAKTGAAVLIILFVFCVYVSWKRKKLRYEKLCLFFAGAGYLLMFLYLAYKGRLPVRTFMVITISAATYLSLTLLKVVNTKTLQKKERYTVIGAICMLFAVLYNIRAIYFTDDCTKTQTQTTAVAEQVLSFENYALENSENVYVYDFTVATLQREPFVVYPDKKPVNCIVSGGSYTFSTIYYKQLEENGLSSLYWKDFLKDNIFYASSDLTFVDLMAANIQENAGRPIHYEEVTSFGEEGVKIYKFLLDIDLEKEEDG